MIAASACVCIVLLLPCAFWTLKSFVLSPAASNACARYGASNETYRADDCVSGSSTAILPLPCLATSLSCAIAEKSFVKSFGETETVPCSLFVLEDEPPPLPHATRPTVARTTVPTVAVRFSEKCMSPPVSRTARYLEERSALLVAARSRAGETSTTA